MKTMSYALFAALVLLAACTQAPQACPMDAKICPDGTAVGRSGPSCEFAPCPAENETAPANDSAPQSESRFMLCSRNEYGDTSFFEDQGWTCVEECPEGYDEYVAQIGWVCVQHYGAEEIASWPVCERQTQCGEATCGRASVTTDGQDIPDAQFRCLPQDYEGFMINRGLELKDENGQTTMVIS